MALWPKGLAAAFNNRATWTADHLPPRATPKWQPIGSGIFGGKKVVQKHHTR
jgi:hypothetical protein